MSINEPKGSSKSPSPEVPPPPSPNQEVSDSDGWGESIIAISLIVGVLLLIIDRWAIVLGYFLDYLRSHPKLFFAIIFWLTGSLISFLISSLATIVCFVSRTSSSNKNLRLIGLHQHLSGDIRECEPGFQTWWAASGELLLGLLAWALFSVFLSWIQATLAIYGLLKGLWVRIWTPSEIKALQWRLANIEYRTAEEYLQVAQLIGNPKSIDVQPDSIAEVRGRVRNITERFALRVFSTPKMGFSERLKVAEDYVKRAEKASKELFNTDVIHPSFWNIPLKKTAAENALFAMPEDNLDSIPDSRD